MCVDSCTNINKATKKAKHPTHHKHGPLRNTLLTVDLPHRRTPYSSCTCTTREHPTHHGPAPQQNTLLTFTSPTWNTLLNQWKKNLRQNHAYGRHQLSRPLQREALILISSACSITQKREWWEGG